MIKIIVSNIIQIHPASLLPFEVKNDIKSSLTFENPLYRMGLKRSRTGSQVTQKLFCWSEKNDSLVVTRGYLQRLVYVLDKNSIDYFIDDQTLKQPAVDIPYHGTLTRTQLDIAGKALKVPCGIVTGAPGRGLEALALYIIAQRRQPFLLIVKRRSRLLQWIDFIADFTGLDTDQVGIIGFGEKEIARPAIVAIDRSLYGLVEKIKCRVGLLVVDLCDIANLKIFFSGVYPFPCSYILGLSTTMGRRDGLNELMEAYLGPRITA